MRYKDIRWHPSWASINLCIGKPRKFNNRVKDDVLGLDRFHICILGTIDHTMQGKWTNTYIWHHICRIYNSAHRTWESCLGSYKNPFDTIRLSPWCWSSKAVRFWSNYWRKWWAAPPKCIPEEVKLIWQRNYTGVKHLYKNLKIIPPLIMLSHQCLLSKSKEMNQKQHVCGSHAYCWILFLFISAEQSGN